MTTDTATTAAVRAAAQRWCEATMTADADALDALLEPGYTYTHASNGRVDPRDVWLESFRTGGRSYDIYALMDESYLVYGDTVILSGRAHQEMHPNGEYRELNTRFLSIWIRSQADPEAWRCAAWQATRLEP